MQVSRKTLKSAYWLLISIRPHDDVMRAVPHINSRSVGVNHLQTWVLRLQSSRHPFLSLRFRQNFLPDQGKLDRGETFSEDRKTCTETVVTSTSSQVEVRVVCENQGVKSNGTLHIDALNPENVKGSMHMLAAGGDHSMNMSSTFSGKWIVSSCGDLH